MAIGRGCAALLAHVFLHVLHIKTSIEWPDFSTTVAKMTLRTMLRGPRTVGGEQRPATARTIVGVGAGPGIRQRTNPSMVEVAASVQWHDSVNNISSSFEVQSKPDTVA
ncbi:hypothetical protein BJV77DRAFT_962941 [Russula vinacea]|nr:hypothetical protein BJV77DRAFT_962941 [Russula vinacea]